MLLTLLFKEESNMALVKCPECGKEVSDTANACPNCGYGVKVHFDKIKWQKDREKINLQTQKMKDINRQNFEKKLMTVKRPKKPVFNKIFKGYLVFSIILITLLYLIYVINDILNNNYATSANNVIFIILMYILLYIATISIPIIVPLGIYYDIYKRKNSEYKFAQQNFREYQKYIIRKQEQKTKTGNTYSSYTSSSQVRCPKCGSTNIQMVNRKWSPLTGFMINKVDRVCVNCKNRF